MSFLVNLASAETNAHFSRIASDGEHAVVGGMVDGDGKAKGIEQQFAGRYEFDRVSVQSGDRYFRGFGRNV